MGLFGKKYDEEGFDKNGFDKNGFDRDGYDKEGYDEFGYDRYGYDKEGYDDNPWGDGYDKDGWDKKGWNKDGIHKVTGREYDELGYRKSGCQREGEVDTDKADWFREYENGYDEFGFDKNGIHKGTEEKYDAEGYDRYGWNKDGKDRNGYDRAYQMERLGFPKSEEEKKKSKTIWENIDQIGKFQDLEKWEDVIKCANILLEMDPDGKESNFEEILWRKGYAYYRLGLEIEALECVKDCKYSEGAIKLKGQLLDKMGMADDGRNYADKMGFNE